jgi:uncharacterized protein (TIGR02453 family)
VSTARFAGFPADAVDFYVGLDADNTKAYWQANKARYQASVRAPMEALLAEVDDEFGPFRVFRPYNDVRFSTSKAPYKTAIGAVSESEGGSTYYVQFSADGILCGAGMYHMASDQLERFRAAVDATGSGEELAALVAAATKAGYVIGAKEELKTAPRGVPKDHPRIEILRRKGLIAIKQWPVSAWTHTVKVKARIVECWRGARPVTDWLDRHVGASTLPPPQPR